MKKAFFRLSVLLSAILCLASCLNGSDDDYVIYGDTAVLGFSLGTMNRYLTTKASDGTDSTYKETYAGSTYKFYIDQINREIYNPDSLPYGTDAKHVICSITTKNSGSVGLKSLISDTVFVYSSADSIDFSQPRHVMVYAMSGNSIRDYTVRVNVHQQQADEFRWTAKRTAEAFYGFTAMKGLVCGGRLFVAGSDGAASRLFSTPLSDGDNWTEHTPDFGSPMSADLYADMVTDGSQLYALYEGKVMASADGNQWTEKSNGSIQKLLGGGAGLLFALRADGTLAESSDGATWTDAQIDADAALIPAQDVSFAVNGLKTDNNVSRIVMTGNRSVTDYPDDKWSVTWVKILDGDATEEMNRWMYCPTEPNMYLLPRLRQLTTVAYGEGILALGAEGIGACTTSAFSKFYYSLDGGLNWLPDSRFYLPTGFSSNGAFAMVSDSDNCLWLIIGGSGQVWRGRLNQLGWDEIQRTFK